MSDFPQSHLRALLGRKTASTEAGAALEKRYVFDAAMAGQIDQMHLAASDGTTVTQHEGMGQALMSAARSVGERPADIRPPDGEFAGRDEAVAPSLRTVVFIDAGVENRNALLANLPDGAEIIEIDGTRDGVLQMSNALDGRNDIGSVHILAHGEAGQLKLGTATLDAETMSTIYKPFLTAMGSHLSDSADILVYGCDFGAGDKGAAAVNLLSELTRADVAASDDLTGASALGGDWALEVQKGTIETDIINASDWDGTLANAPISASGPPVTGGGAGVGATALWTNVAMVGGTAVDIRATVTSADPTTRVSFSTQGDDLRMNLEEGAATVRWDMFVAGTSTPFAGDVNFQIADLDGAGGAPNSIETVSASKTGLTSFTANAPTNLSIDSSGTRVVASGTESQNGEPNSMIRYTWANVSSMSLDYYAAPGNDVRVFNHDGDLDLVFTAPVTYTVPILDLDGDNSTAPGTGVDKTFTENGAGVSVVDTDMSITNTGTPVNGATITLTNSQPGDQLNVGTLPSGVTATVNTSIPGQITVTLTGNSTPTNYEAAIKAITFNNTSDTPSPIDRDIQIAVSNGGATSLPATSIIHVVPVNDAPLANDDRFVTEQDQAVNATVAGNDSDPEGQILNYVVGTGPTHGTLTLNPNGTFVYTPTPGYQGPDSFTYTVSDGAGGTDTATVDLVVTPPNDPPTVTIPIPSQANPDASVVNLNAAATFTDPDGNPLTYSATGLPAGLSINPATGIISGTIDRSASIGGAGSNGVYSVTVRATDIYEAFVQQTFTWTVSNPAPDAVNDGFTTTEDTAVSGTVAGNDTDPDADPLTYTKLTDPAHGTVTMNADGSFTYTPNGNYNGPDSFIYRISDGNGGTDTATVSLTVTAVNDAPVGPAIGNRTNVDNTAVSVNLASGFSDVEGQTLAHSATGLPPGLSVNAATGVVSGTIDKSASIGGPSSDGVYAVTYRVEDGNGGVTTRSFTWTVTNPAPDAQNDSFTTNEDTAISATLVTNDSDPDSDPLSYAVATQPGNGTVVVNPNGTFTYTPTLNYNGTDSFTYTINDGNGGTDSATVNLTIAAVNDDPVFVTPLTARNNLDGQAISINVGAQVTDVDSPLLIYAATGLPPGLSINPLTGLIAGTLDRSASIIGPDGDGVYSVSVTAADLAGGSTTQTFTWTIGNPPPDAVDDAFTATEETAISASVAANDRDPDRDAVTYAPATQPANGTLVFDANGTFTYTPNANFNGTDSFTYTITDANGGTDTATVTLTVTGTNDAPVVTPMTPQAHLDGDQPRLDVSVNFSDIDGNALAYSATGLPPGLSINPVSGVISGTIDRAASQGGTGGSYTVSVTANDGNGGSATQTFTWRIENPPPDAVNDAFTTSEDTAVRATVAGNDRDPDGDPLTFALATQPGNGYVSLNGDGTFIYTPNTNFNGTDSFTYTITDTNGGTDTAIVTLTVTGTNDAPVVTPMAPQAHLDGDQPRVDISGNFSDIDGDTLAYSAAGLPPGLSINPVSGVISGTIDRAASQGGTGGSYTVSVTANDGNGGSATQTFTWRVGNPPPVATDDAFRTSEDTALVGSVAANDRDPDADALSFSLATGPANGTVTLGTDGSFRYLPRTDFSGRDSFTYTISDGNGSTSRATVTIVIDPLNDGPDVVGSATNETSRDTDVASKAVAPLFVDRDGDGLTYSATGLPPGLSINQATGVITGTIASDASIGAGGSGSYNVTVAATDAAGARTSTTFVWSVTNPGPDAVNDVYTTPANTGVTGSLATNDRDPDGDALSFTLTAGPGNGIATVNADGSFAYTPANGFSGIDVFTYRISDGNGGSDTATATITVAAPLAVPTIGLNPNLCLVTYGNISTSYGTMITYTPSTTTISGNNLQKFFW